MCQNVSKSVKMCQKVSKCVKKCRKVSQSVTKCQKVSNSVKKCQKVSKSVKKCQKVSQSVKKCQKVSQSVRKVSKSVAKCHVVFERLLNLSYENTCKASYPYFFSASDGFQVFLSKQRKYIIVFLRKHLEKFPPVSLLFWRCNKEVENESKFKGSDHGKASLVWL